MTKTELAQAIQQQIGSTTADALDHVETTLEVIKAALEAGTPVKIAGFGVFSVTGKHARRGRNPQTGEAITIEARRVLTFKASQVLKDAINQE